MKFRPQLSLLLLVAASLWIAPAACAQDQVEAQTQPPAQSPAQTPDQPTSSVARLSVVQGSVSTQRGDSGDWSAATVNTPVVPGDRVSTGEHSRAEIQLDFANLLRLDENSVVRVTDLAPQRIQIQVSEGLVIFDAFQNSDSEVEIDTPNLAIHPHRGGVYRIQVNSDVETLLVVRRGEAEMGTADGSTTLPAGQLAIVRGDSASAQYKVDAAPARDGFDNWSEERDRLTQ